MSDLLQQIQQLQFGDKGKAESLLLSFVRELFPLEITALELRPQAISLNSFNGFLALADDKRLFFKTHTEEDNVIGEFYNAQLLADAGYPIIQPIHSSKQAGQQLLIYEVIKSPSVFDVAWQLETDNIEPDDSESVFKDLTYAQNESDKQLFAFYVATLETQKAAQALESPIHQLFYHRLTGGRLKRFYGSFISDLEDKQIVLPDGSHRMSEVGEIRWVINGSAYHQTLNNLIVESVTLLNPAQTEPSIIGHGDAHNGNVFFQEDKTLLYFDPAFAGRHHPLLDLVKPLFHNVFAMWMYYPEIKAQGTKITFVKHDDVWHVTHNYHLHPSRHMFLKSKITHTLIPIVQELKRRGLLREDWRRYIKCGLFCCPFLTMNLTDSHKFPPEIALLGLTMSIQMGAESHGERSLIDSALDEVESSL